jgi:hypothetical protein
MEDGAGRSHPPKPTTGAGSPGVMMLPAAWLPAIGRWPCFCSSHRPSQRGRPPVSTRERSAAVAGSIGISCHVRASCSEIPRAAAPDSGAPATKRNSLAADRHIRRPQCPERGARENAPRTNEPHLCARDRVPRCGWRGGRLSQVEEDPVRARPALA